MLLKESRPRERIKQTFQLSNPHRKGLLTHKAESTYNRAEIKIRNRTAQITQESGILCEQCIPVIGRNMGIDVSPLQSNQTIDS